MADLGIGFWEYRPELEVLDRARFPVEHDLAYDTEDVW